MPQLKTPSSRTVTLHEVEQYLRASKLAFIAEHYGELAQHAAHKQWSHLDYLGHLVEGEALLRQDRATKLLTYIGEIIVNGNPVLGDPSREEAIQTS